MTYVLKYALRTKIIIFALILLHNSILKTAISEECLSRFYNGTPVLVTGGCVFIGSHLVEKLVHLGAHVTVLDDLSTGTLTNIATVQDQITFIRGDITDFSTCLAATQNQNLIFHLAAFVSVPASTEDPHQCHTINIIGTENLLEAARINNIKRFVFSSTCAVYGESDVPCIESAIATPISPYGFSKLIGEIYCKEYSQLFNLETVAMRYFNVYGPRQNPQAHYAGVITKFTHDMEHNLPLTIFGDGTQTRDYVPVETVVEANIILGICSKQLIQDQIFNIATGKSSNLFDIIQMLKEKYPLYNNDIIFKPARPGDVKHVTADCSKYNTLYSSLINGNNHE